MKDLGFSNAADKIQPTDAPKCKAGARYGIALLLALCGSPILLTGCDSKPQNPMLQTIPTDSEKWQDKLGDTLDQLSEEDRQLLSRYMLRMRLSEAYEKGAMPRITVGKALEQQRHMKPCTLLIQQDARVLLAKAHSSKTLPSSYCLRIPVKRTA